MRQISKRSASWEKQVGPLCFLVLWLACSLFVGYGAVQQGRGISIVWGPLAFGILGFALLKFWAGSFVDKVWIDGHDIVVLNHGVEDRIPLTNVSSVSGTTLLNPEWITLELNSRSAIGDQISFMPPIRLRRFSENPLVRELRELVATASDEAVNAATQRK
jgi:hypothetical protein